MNGNNFNGFNNYNNYNNNNSDFSTGWAPPNMNNGAYPNNMNGYGTGMQPSSNNMGKKPKQISFLTFLIISLVLGGIAGGGYYYYDLKHPSESEVVDMDKLFEDEIKALSSTPEIRLKELCDGLDDAGNNFKEENIYIKYGKDISLAKELGSCYLNVCTYKTETKIHRMYCETGEISSKTIDENIIDNSLMNGCANIDENGNYNDANVGITCSNFSCTLNYKNKEYTKSCKE